MNIAIVIGVSDYLSPELENLPACKNDANLMYKVLSGLNKYDSILYIDENKESSDVLADIYSFFEDNNDGKVEELLFYFSGHGYRDFDSKSNDDHYCCLFDYDPEKYKTTSIQDSMIDNLARNLKPNNYIKIIDACFSGQKYIKSSGGLKRYVDKASERVSGSLNNTYFIYSSSGDQESYADKEFSVFSSMIFDCIYEHKGEMRYRQLIDGITQQAERSTKNPKPWSVLQGDQLASFGIISDDVKKLITQAYGIGEEEIEGEGEGEGEASRPSVVEYLKSMTESNVFSQSDLFDFIDNLYAELNEISDDFDQCYKVNKSTLDGDQVSSVPNSAYLGEWLKSSEKVFFIKPVYGTRERSEDYLPAIKTMHNFIGGFSPLESYVKGCRYTGTFNELILHLTFTSQFDIADDISFYLVPVFSNQELYLFYSIERLRKTSWGVNSPPQNSQWKPIKVAMKSEDSLSRLTSLLKSAVNHEFLVQLDELDYG